MKKIVLSTIVLMAALQANWMNDNMINVGNSAGYYQTQTRGIYSLGSQSIRIRDVGGTITPAHLEVPRFNIGCGGIDIAMGGFSYLQEEYLIEKLKSISAAAPAFVYQMAISALCKDCQNIMNELEKFANEINGMNFNTCDAIQKAQGAGKAVGEAMNNNIFGGQSDSWLAERVRGGTDTINGWQNSMKGYFGGNDAKAKEMMDILVLDGSLLDLSVKKGLPNQSKLDLLGTDENGDKLILSVFRAAVGDIIGKKSNAGTISSYFSPGAIYNDLFKVVYEGGKLNISSYSTSSKDIVRYSEYSIEKGAREIIKDSLLIIYNKMKNKQILEDSDKRFLSTLTIPIYKYLNTALLSKADSDFDWIAEQLAAIQTKELLEYLSKLIARGVSTYIAVNGKDIAHENLIGAENIIKNINELNKQTMQYYATIISPDSKKSVFDYIRQKDQQLKAQSAYQSFMFGN